MYPPKLKYAALPIPERPNSDCSFGWWLCGEEEAEGSRIVAFERAFAYTLHTFPLSLRVSEILPLLCSSTTFPSPPLVSSKFPYVSLGV